MGAFVILGFLVLFALGFPIALCMGMPAAIYVLVQGFPIEMIATRIANSYQSFTLIAVPMFIMVGNLMNSSGLTRRIFNFADKAVGRLPGGLAQVNCFASLIFAGMSGSALADIGGLGKIEMQAMHEKGFPDEFSGAVTLATSTLGPIFPPSIPLILYASVSGCSVVKLLVGGVLPAIACMLVLMVITGIIASKRKYPRAEKAPTAKEFFGALFPALPALLSPVIIIILMLSGVFTPTEAAAISILYVLLCSIFVYRECTLKSLVTAVKDTTITSCSILLIFPCASLFSWVLTLERIPQTFASAMLSISNDVGVLLIIVNLLLLFVGMFMGNTEAILLLVPIIAPMMTSLGMNEIHLALVIVFNLMIGLITPPFAMSLYMTSNMFSIKMSKLIRESWVYLLALVISLLLITYIPGLTLLLPGIFLK